MARPWNNWIHAMGNTFGTWPPGDARGWRSWRHTEHCEGDYRHPPPAGAHASRLRRSQALMKRPPVALSAPQREIAARAMGERLIELGAEVIDLCVTKMHFHMLVRFAPVGLSAIAMAQLYEKLRLVPGNMIEDGRDPLPRHMVGLAKKHAAFALRSPNAEGARNQITGGVWAAKCKIVPIVDRAHQVRVARYIRDHAEEGGAVLSLIVPEVVARVRKRE